MSLSIAEINEIDDWMNKRNFQGPVPDVLLRELLDEVDEWKALESEADWRLKLTYNYRHAMNRVLEALNALDAGAEATKSRDFGRGVAHAVQVVRQALADMPDGTA